MTFVRPKAALAAAAAVTAMALLGLAQSGHLSQFMPGTLIVSGSLFHSPTLVRARADVAVGGASIRDLLAQPEHIDQPQAVIPQLWQDREQVIENMFSRFEDLIATRDLATARWIVRGEVASHPAVGSATVQGSSVVITWNNGDIEDMLLAHRGQKKESSSTMERLENNLDDYQDVLNRGGIVALGVNYILVATGAQADRLRTAMNAAQQQSPDPAAAIDELERSSGSRSFARDFIRINKH